LTKNDVTVKTEKISLRDYIVPTSVAVFVWLEKVLQFENVSWLSHCLGKLIAVDCAKVLYGVTLICGANSQQILS